ncbi:MAG: hypothetical protein JWR16_1781 [Nevskia sp.]|nr:hypothetical protein [Nevskia sp.]
MPRLPSFVRPLIDRLFSVDLRTLALFRALLGAVVFVDLCNRALDLRTFYTDLGVMPRDWMLQLNGLWRISLYSANGETWFVSLLFVVEMLAALALLLGWRTRIATVLLFVLHGSLLNRDQMVLLGADILLECLLFWSMFLPLAARWSVDATLADPKPALRNPHLSCASAGLLLQVMSVYFFSALLKYGREWWPDGTAVDLALQIDGYATPIGVWLRGFYPLTHWLTYFVWLLELLGPIAVFFPFFNKQLRFGTMLLLMVMHIGFLLCLSLGPFPFASLTSLTVLIGGWVWDALDRRKQRREDARGKQPLRIYYDRDCGFCLKSCLLYQTFLILPRVQIAPAQDTPRAKALLEANYSWVVIDHDDRAYLKWPAFVQLLKRSPLFFWLGFLLQGSWAVPPGNWCYDFVGRHRGAFGAATGALMPYHQRRFDTGIVAQVLAGIAVVAVFTWNLCTAHLLIRPIYAFLTPPFRVLRLDQLWDMFAPFPSKEDGWFVIPGELLDGTQVDVYHPERDGVSYDKPEYVVHEWPNIRWHKYMERIWSAEYSSNRLYYGRYLCRSWNASHAGAKQLKTFRIVYMLELSVPHGETPHVEQRVLWNHECFDARLLGGSTGH